MAPPTTAGAAAARHDFIISRTSESDSLGVWRFDPEAPELLTLLPGTSQGRLDPSHQLIPIGRYVFDVGPEAMAGYLPSFPFRLYEFDPLQANPLSRLVRAGAWPKRKFFASRPDFGNPDGASKAFDTGQSLWLLPLGSFMLNIIPSDGRGTFQLWNFDPGLAPGKNPDPLPAAYTSQGAFQTIQTGHELTPMGNYVLDRRVDSGEYWVWSFDPQCPEPLGLPAVQHGLWKHFSPRHRLVAVGEHVISWVPGLAHCDLWHFDPTQADPLQHLRSATLPAAFDANTTLQGIQPPIPVDPARAAVPGTIDHMRTKIKHVVYYMLENRSFDHVCGFLYGKGEKHLRIVGRDGPFQGADPETQYNLNPTPNGNQKVFIGPYQGGKLSNDYGLDFLPNDPYHDKSDVLGQLFYKNRKGYEERARPDMGGFVWNNATGAIMQAYTPQQLPVLNGLAREFAVSDEWFASMPGATDPNRAFAFTGSTLGELNNFQNGVKYTYWPYTPHRQSIWKLLYSFGIQDWKIYNSIEWMDFVHTYHLFLQGQIPSVDANTADFVQPIEQFKKDAAAGKLPAFSVLEPVWIGTSGTTSYHPGADLVAGERALNEIYEAIRNSPQWEETLFVITFDEHGGIYDHVPPPYAAKPWPHDVDDGFHYDLMGVRVPTLLVSPWVDEKTVFRSPTPVAYDHTSFLATLLHWFGIPKSRWAMGDRTHHAPTFEGVLSRSSPRQDKPGFKPPYDKFFPAQGESTHEGRLNDLHQLMVPRIIAGLVRGKLSDAEVQSLTEDIMGRASTPKALHRMLKALEAQFA